MQPRVFLNCACSLDGRIAAPDGSPMGFSDDVDWRRVHELRASVDAILVGVGTIETDNPSLKLKEEFVSPRRKAIARVVLDTHGRIPAKCRVLDGSAPTFVVTGPSVSRQFGQAKHIAAKARPDGHLDLADVLDKLWDEGLRWILVEGGARVLRAFLDTDLVAQWTLYQAPVLVGAGPSIFEGKPSPIGRRLHVENVQPQGKGILWTFRP